jgi:cytochrome c-type biogenesis protein CcmH/NrfG
VSVNGTIMVACGTFVGVSSFLLGRYYASRTPEQAAAMKMEPAKLRQLSRILMINAPILFAIFVGLGLTGMAG